ncbi:MAG: hypothetical protein HOP29_13710, partial [Phycisphaerales bacterium]|nr:hypothetical protein [Phycisphaerales bacterium]
LEYRPNELVRVEEPMGTLPTPRAGMHLYRLSDRDGKTCLRFSYQGLGVFGPEDEACMSSGWGELLNTHFRAWVEEGKKCSVQMF